MNSDLARQRAAGPEAERNAGYELTLVPAYGRDYQTAEALLKDWHAGKDFQIACVVSLWNGAYASVRDLKQFPGVHVKIRYDRLARFVLVSIADGSVQQDDVSLDDNALPIDGPPPETPSGPNPEVWL